jgi:hypothetical protein
MFISEKFKEYIFIDDEELDQILERISKLGTDGKEKS